MPSIARSPRSTSPRSLQSLLRRQRRAERSLYARIADMPQSVRDELLEMAAQHENR